MKSTNLDIMQAVAIERLEKDFSKENILHFIRLCGFGAIKVKEETCISKEDLNWIMVKYNTDSPETKITLMTILIDKEQMTAWTSPTYTSLETVKKEEEVNIPKGTPMSAEALIRYNARNYIGDIEQESVREDVSHLTEMEQALARLFTAINVGYKEYVDGYGNCIPMIERSQIQLEIDELSHLLPFSSNITEAYDSDDVFTNGPMKPLATTK